MFIWNELCFSLFPVYWFQLIYIYCLILLSRWVWCVETRIFWVKCFNIIGVLCSMKQCSILYLFSFQVCAAKGPRPRYPRVWKTKRRIGTISKAAKLVQSVCFHCLPWSYLFGQFNNLSTSCAYHLINMSAAHSFCAESSGSFKFNNYWGSKMFCSSGK